jgi:hypothetical protein
MTHFNSALFPPIAAVRAVQKLLPKKGGAVDHQHSDTAETPKLANAVLKQLFAAERLIVGRVRMPFGGSIVAVASG